MRLHGLYLNLSEDKVDHVAVYSSTDFDHRPIVAAEIAESRWCDPGDLPRDTARGTAARIREHFAGGVPHHGDW
jgi:hypothetical protein